MMNFDDLPFLDFVSVNITVTGGSCLKIQIDQNKITGKITLIVGNERKLK